MVINEGIKKPLDYNKIKAKSIEYFPTIHNVFDFVPFAVPYNEHPEHIASLMANFMFRTNGIGHSPHTGKILRGFYFLKVEGFLFFFAFV